MQRVMGGLGLTETKETENEQGHNNQVQPNSIRHVPKTSKYQPLQKLT